MSTSPNVPVGIASKVGYLTGALGVIYTIATAITASEAQLHGPGKWAAILGVIAVVATNLGRQLQAAAFTLPHLETPAVGGVAAGGDVTVLPAGAAAVAPAGPAREALPTDAEETAAPQPTA